MKRNMAVITACIIGISYCSSDMIVKASQKEGNLEDTGNFMAQNTLGRNSGSETDWERAMSVLGLGQMDDRKEDGKIFFGNGMYEEIKEESPEPVPDEDFQKSRLKNNPEESEERQIKPATPEPENLQMPQKLEVVIDPWNMDGKGQIYSDEYVIRNMGENTGILKLSNLVCRPREQSGVTIKTNKSRIHDDGEKSVYMEMVFGSEDRVVLSEDGSEYTAELKPGEELLVSFTGEVNENASKEWKNEEVTVGVRYTWNMKETEEANAGQAEEAASEAVEEVGEEGGTKGNDSVPAAWEQRETEADEAKEIIMEDMNAPQETAVSFGSWNMDEAGQMLSGQYVIRNTGENPGNLRLSDLICRSGIEKQKEIPVRMVQEEMEAREETCIYIEMVPEDGGKPLLSQENQENSGLEIKLEPGEKVTFHFTGERKGTAADDLKAEDLELMGTISWILEEETS